MKELVRHIEYLIIQHDCVIIPGLGGFVLNREAARIDKMGLFLPPKVGVGFNADLKHNDGLLAKSYSQYFSVTYDAACAKLDVDVKHIKHSLQSDGRLPFGNLGIINLIDGRIVFEPNSSIPYPSVWGYSALKLDQIDANNKEQKQLQPNIVKASKRVFLRKVLISVGATAAAVALLFIPVSNDSSLFNKVQHSGFFSGYTNNIGKRMTDNEVVSENRILVLDKFEEYQKHKQQEQIAVVEVVEPEVSKRVEAKADLAARIQPLKKYYIIVGGDPGKAQANNLLRAIKSKGFGNAQIVESADRYRIYVASFNDKTEANLYLDSFRKKYPSYSDAWLFTKRN